MPTFTLTLSSTASETDAVRELRALLKRALRSHGFRCTDAVQVSTFVELENKFSVLPSDHLD
jgi:hypothetical protein